MPATAETQAQQQHLLTRLPFWPLASTHSSTTTLSHWAFLPITKGWPACTLISTMLVSPNSSLPQAPSGRRRLMWSAFVSASEAWFSSHARACPVSRARGTRARTWPTRCRGAGPVLDVKAAVCASFRHHHQGDDFTVYYGHMLVSNALTIHCAPRPVSEWKRVEKDDARTQLSSPKVPLRLKSWTFTCRRTAQASTPASLGGSAMRQQWIWEINRSLKQSCARACVLPSAEGSTRTPCTSQAYAAVRSRAQPCAAAPSDATA